ncbi:hypothetical protein JXA34_00220 [Patescibacteria group bacterium]|nr:hypothetical protein [Patescibacteria group bacterium]
MSQGKAKAIQEGKVHIICRQAGKRLKGPGPSGRRKYWTGTRWSPERSQAKEYRRGREAMEVAAAL